MTERDDETGVRELLETAGARPEVPRDDLEAIVGAARAEWRTLWGSGEGEGGEAPSRPRWPAVAALLAATLVVAAGLALWWQGTRGAAAPPELVARVERVAGPVGLSSEDSGRRDLAAGDPVPAGALVETGGEAGGPLARAALRLANGTTVRLDAESRLVLRSPTRLELERGAIYVDTETAGGAGGALEVETPLGTARDVGTQFVVRVAPGGEGTLRVQVRRGAVELERRGRTYRAVPGDELVARGEAPVERGEVSPHGRQWEWVIDAAPPFELEGRTVRELLDWVSRETGWRILYEDEALAAAAGEIVVHGSAGGLRADQAAFTVLPGAGLEAELGGGVLVVRRAEDSAAPRI